MILDEQDPPAGPDASGPTATATATARGTGTATAMPALTPAQRRRDRERVAAREMILSAALVLARRDGWDAVTMRRLADEIEYSANFAYRYFTGRDDILHALVRDAFARLRDAMAAAGRGAGLDSDGGSTAAGASAGTGADEAAAALRRAGHAYLDFALAEPDLYQLMYGLGGVRVPALDAWAEGQAVGDLIADLLAAAGDPAPERHVLQLWATAHGLVALLAVGRGGGGGGGGAAPRGGGGAGRGPPHPP
ncbi:TetR/AcrR family transcriptional regulator, partial [Streptacidiphilus fuscans]